MDETREIVSSAILEVVDNQLRDNDPPQTKSTYNRLIGLGYSDDETRRLIAFVVLSELNEMVKQMKPFNQRRFARALRRLPEVSWE